MVRIILLEWNLTDKMLFNLKKKTLFVAKGIAQFLTYLDVLTV